MIQKRITEEQLFQLLAGLGIAADRPVTRVIIDIGVDRIATIYTAEHLRVDMDTVLKIVQEYS